MEFQTLKKSHLKRNIIIGVVCIAIISAVVLNFTRAKYRTTQSIPLVTGTINYSLADLNIVAITIDGKEVDTIPEGNYELTSESYCTVNGKEDSSIKLSYDSTTKGLSVTPMTSKGTKCYLYFDTDLGGNAGEEILTHYKTIKTRSLPFTTSTIVTDTTTGTIYKAQDDWGDTYYFAGNPTDNWMKFAGYYWRIIRINGDGSIRLIYNGTSTQATGTSTTIYSSQVFNSSYNRSEYVGYMYTSGQQHGNTTDSPIKDVLDSWYSSNLASYADKISKEAGFCGDREMTSGYSWSSQPSSTIYYAGYGRLVQNSSSVNPTFKCSNSNDLYTSLSSSKGNRKLSNPIGLITADEVIMGGLPWNGTTASNYLYTGQAYWTMTPYRVDSLGGVDVFSVDSTGALHSSFVDSMFGVRPVINLSADVKVTGSGTAGDPFVVL